MRDSLKRKAAEVLRGCADLDAAEKALGGAWNGQRRDRAAAALTWALFDGYKGRPAVPLKGFEADYAEAYEIGRRLTTVPVAG